MKISNNVNTGDAAREGQADLRQQLYNEQLAGPAAMIQLPAAAITGVHGILLDFDPKLIMPGNSLFPHSEDPLAFFEGIETVLARHPLTRTAEVRMTGTGIHVIPRFDPAIELASAADQQKYATLVRAVQRSLPTDFNAPGITGLTRAIGSVNSKNGARVEIIRPGEAIDPGEIDGFVMRLLKAPFGTVATILIGADRLAPCPVCRGEGSRLDILDLGGKCYARCGNVTLAQLFDCVYRPFAPARKAEENVEDKAEAAKPRGKAGPTRKKISSI